MERYDAIVIGGGVVGCGVASHLGSSGRVLLLEREADVLQRASYVNQARVHNGYHYPRSLLTALRSRVNFPRFVAEFEDCVDREFDHFYAVARNFSNVTAGQFVRFCGRIGARIEPAPAEARRLFDPHMVEDVFQVQEYAFDAAKLGARFRERLRDARVDVRLSTTADRVEAHGDGLAVTFHDGDRTERAVGALVFNCTYSRTNVVLAASGLSIVPLKHELTELPLLRVPPILRAVGITVMCGPFFSVMPFPSRGLHSIHHVRYTPHRVWHEGEALPVETNRPQRGENSRFPVMVRDAARYLPAIEASEHVESLWETKTILPASEIDDSRPMLFRRDAQLRNLISIVGGKIDNIFDIFVELDRLQEAGVA